MLGSTSLSPKAPFITSVDRAKESSPVSWISSCDGRSAHGEQAGNGAGKKVSTTDEKKTGSPQVWRGVAQGTTGPMREVEVKVTKINRMTLSQVLSQRARSKVHHRT